MTYMLRDFRQPWVNISSGIPATRSAWKRLTHDSGANPGLPHRRRSCYGRELIVYRAIILSVVLLFAAGPSVSLVCKAWCDPHVAAENGCHHEDNGGAASLSSDDSCDDSFQGPTGVLKEDLRRAPAPDGGAVLLTAHFQIIPLTTLLVPAWSRGRPLSDTNQPQTTPLRI